MADPYSVLGVKRDADADEIKRAYRRLAKANHPDRNREDPKAQDKFARLNAAYEILGDENKRRAFDRGEIDGEGKPRSSGFSGFNANDFERTGFGAGSGGMKYQFHSNSNGPFSASGFGGRPGGDPRDIFSDLFRQFDPNAGTHNASSNQARPSPATGQDVTLTVDVPLETVATGGAIQVDLPDGRAVEVKIPQGIAHGATMRLKGQGKAGERGGIKGDALLTIRYARHARFFVDGADIRVAIPFPIRDAVLGGTARVPTLNGDVEITIPAWTSGGKIFRLRGKGLPHKDRTGDLLVTLDLDLGKPDDALEVFFRSRSA